MNIRQILLVLKREYLTRVKSKAFILTTILIPLGMAAFIGIMVAITVWDSEPEHTIAIVDQTGALYPRLVQLDENRYDNASSVPVDTLRSQVMREQLDGYIVFKEENIESDKNAELVYGGSGGFQLLNSLRDDVREVIRQERLERANVSEEVKKIYESRPGLESRRLTEEGKETDDNIGMLTGLGMAMGILIFGIVTGYGGLLTRSVIEEKTSRIIEIVTSSVKPIELLCGKIIGVGALAVTQVAIWIAAGFGLTTVASPVAAMFMQSQSESMKAAGEASGAVDSALFEIPAIAPSLIVLFFVFLIFGFLIYSTMFAAIGSAADSETDTQQFMFPVMVPIFIAYLLLFRIMEAPDTSMAVISSLIPFFSPILMVTRVAITDVPIWQTALSIVLMAGTFWGMLWLSAKIYSVGILNYGKSASFKELVKWIRQ
ncbi:ABC transporter permease [Aliifodinibius sp. S!AR15-10]|uniref:ABC transporter permease n=1 Tax=Aliifodinibius sp. S!AR15-10 TaxID=2950437 RepID=UPI002860863B|nr:ABC transporter permease [Aliifodinibius sp. S!AR15-10]MDR8390417.1 ABC transporter permease [Aliifodinibius sp. S!AR15-10]